MLIAFPGWTQRDCRSFDYRQQQLNADASLAEKVEAVEQFTHMQLHRPSVTITGEGTKETVPAVITIPVVVHIIYNISSQNISDAQVQSQLDVLNADYGKHNADTSLIPSYYTGLASDCGFRFVLAGVDTNGHSTTGVVRKQTNAVSFSLNDDVKFSARGGDDAWDRDRYLNVWVCNLSGNVLGYSSLVGGPQTTDGVVIKYTAFGTKGTALSPYNRGRTATHEIGHWLNLIHVWGDSPCGDDQVGDTPPQQQATYGDPSGIVISCNNAPYGNLYMNYMDFTDDIGMHLFTNGQRARMRVLFVDGGFRHALLASPAAVVSTPAQASGAGVTLTASVMGVYPNPTMNTTTVKLTETGGVLGVYNLMGARVMAVRVTQASVQLDLSGLAGGIYFVRMEGKSGGIRIVKL